MSEDFSLEDFIEQLKDGDVVDALETYLPFNHWLTTMSWTQNDIHNGGLFQHYENQTMNPYEYIKGCEKIGATKELRFLLMAKERFPNGEIPIRTSEDHMPIEDKLTALGITRKTFDDILDEYFKGTDDIEELVRDYALKNAESLYREGREAEENEED